MGFSSIEYIFLFMPFFAAAYRIMPGRFRNALLLAGSLVFYFAASGAHRDPAALILLASSAVVNWLAGLLASEFPRSRKLWIAVSVIFNFGILFFFKYAGAAERLITGERVVFEDLIFPLGISFYSFKAVGYTADVCRGHVAAETSPVRFAAWFCMFPTVTAGPITGYGATSKELDTPDFGILRFNDGIRAFVTGLAFKVLLADRIYPLFFAVSTTGWDSVSTPLAWLSMIAYSLYIYFDFAGYSLMAIGTGRMLGFELPENFRTPYMSKSMTEFWRRWHITLGAWFKNYIYIPLGGSRRGKAVLIFSSLAVWLFTGIWHGSTLNFLIWGLFLFAVVMLEKFFIGKYLNRFPWLGHIYMAFLIPVSWTIFAFPKTADLAGCFERLFPFLPQGEIYPIYHDWLAYLGRYWYYLMPGLVFCTSLPGFIEKKLSEKPAGRIVCDAVLAALFVASVWFLRKFDSDVFMYGNF